MNSRLPDLTDAPGADLRGANLDKTDVRGAKGLPRNFEDDD